jgi:hypothetical protein
MNFPTIILKMKKFKFRKRRNSFKKIMYLVENIFNCDTSINRITKVGLGIYLFKKHNFGK